MPRYTIKNTETGEQTEFWGSYDEMKKLVSENPVLTNVMGAPKIISGVGSVRDSGAKLPEGFKDKLREMKKKHPMSSGVDHLL